MTFYPLYFLVDLAGGFQLSDGVWNAFTGGEGILLGGFSGDGIVRPVTGWQLAGGQAGAAAAAGNGNQV